MTASNTIDFYFDFSSSYSYLAQSQVAKIEHRTGERVVWRPILLGIIYKQLDHVIPTANSVKMKYLAHDLERCAKELEISYQTPIVFPFNAIEAMRIFYYLDNKDSQQAQQFAKKVFDAAYTQNIDVTQSNELAKIVKQIGNDYFAIVESETFEQAKLELKNQTNKASELYLFGAPTFVYQNEIFWGADRIHSLIAKAAI